MMPRNDYVAAAPYSRSSCFPSGSSGTAIDPLSDILAAFRPESHFPVRIDVGGGSAVRFGNRPGTIKCHAVTAGTCWLTLDGTPAPVRLTAGDWIIVPGGSCFTLGSDPGRKAAEVRDVLARSPSPGGVVLHEGGGDFAFAGTRFEVDVRTAGTLLRSLPPFIHLREPGDRDAMGWYLTQLMTELREGRPGVTLAARHLAHRKRIGGDRPDVICRRAV